MGAADSAVEAVVAVAFLMVHWARKGVVAVGKDQKALGGAGPGTRGEMRGAWMVDLVWVVVLVESSGTEDQALVVLEMEVAYEEITSMSHTSYSTSMRHTSYLAPHMCEGKYMQNSHFLQKKRSEICICSIVLRQRGESPTTSA